MGGEGRCRIASPLQPDLVPGLVDWPVGMRLSAMPDDFLRKFILMSPLSLGLVAREGAGIKPYKLHQAIDKALLSLGHGDGAVKRLIINVPSQTGKTWSLVHFVVWHLIRFPERRVMYVSYGDDRASAVGVDIKNVFHATAERYFDLKMDESLKGRKEWRFMGHIGGFMARGLSGPVTGYAGDVIIFDDPYKDITDAWSSLGRLQVEQKWETLVRTRLQEDTILCLTQTRWHQEDLTGKLRTQEDGGGEQWVKLIVPALPEQDVYDTTGALLVKAGDSPECRKTHEFFINERNTISRYIWDSMYQQRPSAFAGTQWGTEAFGADCVVEDFPACTDLVIGVDPATGKDLARGDFSAIVCVGVNGDGNLYVDADLQRGGPGDTIARLIRYIQVLGQRVDMVGIENLSFQDHIKQVGAEALRAANIHTPVIGIMPTMRDSRTGRDLVVDKDTRICNTLDPLIRGKRFRFIRSIGTAMLMKQLESFPMAGNHKDGPDALEIALRVLQKSVLYKQELRSEAMEMMDYIGTIGMYERGKSMR